MPSVQSTKYYRFKYRTFDGEVKERYVKTKHGPDEVLKFLRRLWLDGIVEFQATPVSATDINRRLIVYNYK